MNLIQNYESSSESEGEENHPKKQLKMTQKIEVNLAPTTDITKLQEQEQDEINKNYKKIYKDPSKKQSHVVGHIKQVIQEDFSFDQQYYNYKKYGFAYDPDNSQQRVVFNEDIHPELAAQAKSGQNVSINQTYLDDQNVFGIKRNKQSEKYKKLAKEKNSVWDASSSQFSGSWQLSKNQEELLQEQALTQEQQDILAKNEERRKKQVEEEKTKEKFTPYSRFHLDTKVDYQNRSFIIPPSDLRYKEHACFIPKKIVNTYTGHQKQVSSIQFFPRYGHFLLSGSFDSKIKLWSIYNQKKCVQTYFGHTEAVRDVYFQNDGLHFLSCGFDKIIRYWDTETGQVIQSFNLSALPFQARFNPAEEKQHSFLVASKNKKIGQYDVRSGKRTQQYDEHLSSINTITFFDNNKKFASTSDDKNIFVWEFGIPVVFIHVREPNMNSITQTALHPSKQYFVGQAQNNEIVVYDTKGGKFRLNSKKKFKGHLTSGYSIGLCFSPDGQYLASGDQDGNVWFWDWKTTKSYRRLEVHDKACSAIQWHPIEPSKVATCGWDNTIKYLD